MPNFIPPDASTLKRWLKILGKEPTIGKSRFYNYDRNSFKEIKTEEDAYWLGFITADGCIIENKWLSIALAERDRGQLVKFCKYLKLSDEEIKSIIKDGFGGAYTRDNPTCSIKICSNEIISNLVEKGIEPRKSGKEKPYKCNTVELERAYIRGLVDGDGYLRSTQYGFGIVGSKEICSYVKEFLNKNVLDTSTNNVLPKKTIYYFAVSGKNRSSTIVRYLYENANIYLQRKYDLYLERYK